MIHRCELLAPCGSKETFEYALNGGCDAIYLGGKSFSARAYASNLTNEEIALLITKAHLRDVKVYVTVNTLIFEDEFDQCVEFVAFLYAHQVDGILLQDLGLAYYLHQVFPLLTLHASTQLNCHNYMEAKALVDMGFKRIVLAREVSIDEIKKIKSLGVEIEVFVHGALCVSYSGSCLMSSFRGGRSGNRGRCAQTCRNEFYINDDKKVKFALSTKDLCTIEYVDELIKMGVDSLKIEGRMKKEEYVYQVVSSYRKAIDNYYQKNEINFAEEKKKMGSLFSRLFTKGFIFKEPGSKTLNQKTSSHQGLFLGKVVKVEDNYLYVLLSDTLNLNDGIRINNDYQLGQIVQKMFVDSQDVKKAYPSQIVKIKAYKIKAKVNDEVIKTTPYDLIDQIDKLAKIPYRLPLDLSLNVVVGNKMKLKGTYLDIQEEVSSETLIAAANKTPTSSDRIKEQLSKLNDSQFYLRNFTLSYQEDGFIPIKELNDLRRNLIEKINQRLLGKLNYSREEYHSFYDKINTKAHFALMCIVENEPQLLEAKKFPYKKIFVNDYALYQKYQDHPQIHYAEKRINHNDQKEATNGSMIAYLKGIEGQGVASPYFNLVNSYSLDMAYHHDIDEIILSFELSKENIEIMIDAFYQRNHQYPALIMPIYGKIDLMIMKSCPVAAYYQKNNIHCQLCKKHHDVLKDGKDYSFEMIHDENCITRILNPHIYYLIDKIDELKKMHIEGGYLMFTLENEDEVNEISQVAFDMVDGKEKKVSLDALTRGHYLKRIE